MFETGFLGTRAPFFMDMITLYFAIMPFLVAYSIYLAKQKKIALHVQSQLAIFALSMVMVVIFEIGVRVDGGFNAYMQESSFAYGGVLSYLILHILIALATVVAWGITIYSAMKAYREEGVTSSYFKAHRKRAKWVFLAIVITSIMGTLMYPVLFIL